MQLQQGQWVGACLGDEAIHYPIVQANAGSWATYFCVLRPVAEGTGRGKWPIRDDVVVLRASSFCPLTRRRQGLGYGVAEEDSHWPTLTVEARCWLRTRTPR